MVVMSRVVLLNGGNLYRLPSTSWKTEIYRPEDLKLGCFSICLIFLTNIAPSLSLPSFEGNGVFKKCQLALERGRKLISVTQKISKL